MFKRFQEFILRIADFSTDELETIKSLSQLRHYSKRSFLLRMGEPCASIAWVAEGCIRLYAMDADDKEHIIEFGFEGDFVTDRSSFLSGKPSHFHIDAIEDTDVFLFSQASLNSITSKVPQFAQVIRKSTMHHLVRYQTRVMTILTLKADEKYKLLLKQQPKVLQRVPLGMIASYLGITPATLSRVRNKRDHR